MSKKHTTSEFIIKEWFQSKGLKHDPWEFPFPRDNYDLTSIRPATWPTEVEQNLDAEESHYEKWIDKTIRRINKRTKCWSMAKQLTFYCYFVYDHEPLDVSSLGEIINRCYPLLRDRNLMLSRAKELCGDESVIFTQKSIGYLLGLHARQVANYVSQLKIDLQVIRSTLEDVEVEQYWK